MTSRIDDFKSQASRAGGFSAQNLFKVTLPRIAGAPLGGSNPRELNMLCRAMNIPGRQVQSTEKTIGTVVKKVANGYVTDDVSLTFYAMNDYGVRQYFEAWQSLAHDQDTYTIGYYKEYTYPVTLQALKKGTSFPIKKRQIFDAGKIPSSIRGRLPRLGPIDLAQGEFDLSAVFGDQIAYTCTLEECYPTTLQAIEYNNDPDGILEIGVQLSYKDWKSEKGDVSSGLVEGLAGQLIRKLI
tara:strand:- start:23836 stop:24555 length:720 start_codon:yes stop_codon:yes gene_type:complete